MQLSLFDSFETEKKVDDRMYFYITLGLAKDKLKYGGNEKMDSYTLRFEDKNDIIRILTQHGYSMDNAEQLVQKTMDNSNTWYDYIEEMYIF